MKPISTLLIFTSLLLPFAIAPTQAAPLSADCQAGIQTAKAALTKAGASVKTVERGSIRGYHNIPSGISERLTFKVANLPKDKKPYLEAAQAVKSCESIGLVQVGRTNSGEIISLGIIEGKYQPFRAATIVTPGGTLPWGYELSGQ